MYPVEMADPLISDCMDRFCRGEFYRLVDTDCERVYDYHDGKLILSDEPCYAIWKRGAACINCISKRAVTEGKRYIKLDMTDGKVFLICASPVTILGRTLSLEAIWNVTERLATTEGQEDEDSLIHDLIDRFNLFVVQDAYTGLFNKKYAEQQLQNGVVSWSPQCPLTVVMMDIDEFKEVNDRYGHIRGDMVIRKLAGLLRECAGELSGTVCRAGGDEFIMIFRGSSSSEVARAVDRLKKQVFQMEFGQEETFHISVSAGIAEYTEDMGCWEVLLDRADQFMYMEKRKKRGQ